MVQNIEVKLLYSLERSPAVTHGSYEHLDSTPARLTPFTTKIALANGLRKKHSKWTEQMRPVTSQCPERRKKLFTEWIRLYWT